MDPARALWIGGPPGVGKTAIAMGVAAELGLRLYSFDGYAKLHEARMPVLGDDDYRSYARHRFRLALEDIRALPDGSPVIVEGAELLGTSVSAVAGASDQVLYVLPDVPADQLERLIAREVRELRYASLLAEETSVERVADYFAPAVERLSAAGGTSR